MEERITALKPVACVECRKIQLWSFADGKEVKDTRFHGLFVDVEVNDSPLLCIPISFANKEIILARDVLEYYFV